MCHQLREPLEPGSLDQYFHDHYDKLQHVALIVSGGDEEVAQNALGELYEKLRDKWHEYDPSRSFRSWATTILRNKVIDQFRRKRRSNAIVRYDTDAVVSSMRVASSESPDAGLLREEVRTFLDSLLAGLTEEEQKIVVARDLEGCSYAEIGNMIEVTLERVVQLYRRAKRKLRYKAKTRFRGGVDLTFE